MLKIFYSLDISNSAKHGRFPFPRCLPTHRLELSDYSSRAPVSKLLFGLCHPAQTRLWALQHCYELFLLFTEATTFIYCHFHSLDKRLEYSDPPLWSHCLPPGRPLPLATFSLSSGVSSTSAFHWKCFGN